MDKKQRTSLIAELGESYIKKEKVDSRYEERTGSLTGLDPSLDDIPRESRTEVPIQKDLYGRISHNDWRCFVVRNKDLRINDTLVFKELDGLTQTGQFIIKTVDYIIKDPALKEGYVIAGWKSM